MNANRIVAGTITADRIIENGINGAAVLASQDTDLYVLSGGNQGGVSFTTAQLTLPSSSLGTRQVEYYCGGYVTVYVNHPGNSSLQVGIVADAQRTSDSGSTWPKSGLRQRLRYSLYKTSAGSIIAELPWNVTLDELLDGGSGHRFRTSVSVGLYDGNGNALSTRLTDASYRMSEHLFERKR